MKQKLISANDQNGFFISERTAQKTIISNICTFVLAD